MQSVPTIDAPLVRQLVAEQFPEFSGLDVRPVTTSGWDNRTFHLGNRMLARFPSTSRYAPQVRKEQFWLPKLAEYLPVEIPKPIALGMPAFGFPFEWSIYEWIEGHTLASDDKTDHKVVAYELAKFLKALQHIDVSGAPKPDQNNFFRGGSLNFYDTEVREAASALRDVYPDASIIEIWERGLKSSWERPAVWVHGDVSANNILLQDGHLHAVIDFGQLAAGDPACDLAIAWNSFAEGSRKVFRNTLIVDAATWHRGKCWALWKALIVRAGAADALTTQALLADGIIQVILAEPTQN